MPGTPRAPRVRMPLPPNVPKGPVLIRVGGRIFNLSEKAIRTYCEEYGLSEDLSFDFNECVSHIVLELEEALLSNPVSVSRRTPAVRMQSRNLVFTMIGSSVVGIRISLKYSSRGRSSQMAIGEEILPEK